MSCHRQELSTTVFSPSSARIAASTAKDWAFVDSWLLGLLPNERLPDYERNPATLTALLALAGVNEAATNDHHLLSAASKLALVGAEHATIVPTQAPRDQNGLSIRTLILSKVGDYLTREGKIALGALADTSVQHKIYFPSPEDLGREFMNLQTLLCETEQVVARINALNEYLILQLQDSAEQLAIFEGSAHASLPIELPKQNLDLQRRTRLKAKQMSDARELTLEEQEINLGPFKNNSEG
ncbi:hypothetical protein E4U41_000160 [Claviceps citrina]|nr:hypothetical protein E4U41_000160 [Claviceps citrina]